MRINGTMSLMFALCVVGACSDSSDGVNASQESLRRSQSADAGAVADDHDRDADESAEEALTDGGHHQRGFEDGDGGHHHRGPVRDFFGDGGCRCGQHAGDAGDDRGEDRGGDHGGRGHGHHDDKGEDGGRAP